MDPTYESLRPAKEFAAPGRRILRVRAEQLLKARKVQRVYLTDGNQASSVIVLVIAGRKLWLLSG